MAKTVFKKLGEHIPKEISSGQAKDTGMAMVLICLLIVLLGDSRPFLWVGVVLLVVDMISPAVFRPLAKVWFGFSRLLGAFVSKILFRLIFIALVIPVGFVRRLMGKDALLLKRWKKGTESVFKVRDHEYVPSDVAHPF